MMLLVFTLDNWQCALDISIVQRVYRAAAVTALPAAPDIVLGIINIHGKIFPVIDIRKRFRLQPKTLSPDDRMIITHTAKRPVVLIVDGIRDVVTCNDDQIIPASNIVPGLEHLDGVIRTNDSLVLIHNIERFLSLEEETLLERALENS